MSKGNMGDLAITFEQNKIYYRLDTWLTRTRESRFDLGQSSDSILCWESPISRGGYKNGTNPGMGHLEHGQTSLVDSIVIDQSLKGTDKGKRTGPRDA